MRSVHHVRPVSQWSVAFALVACAACSGSSPNFATDDAGPAADHDSGSVAASDSGVDASRANDSGIAQGSDASTLADAGSHPDVSNPPPPVDAGDGTPTRQACTGNLGSALSSTHGRLDGTLVAIVGLGGSHACNGDSSHVHLQVMMSGAVYDVAVNSDTLVAERDLPLTDGAWSEGWHTNDALDYATLGLHSSDFTQPSSPAALAQQLENELASVNHISVFATGYGPSGAHLVHRNGGGRDGAIVTRPLSSPAHAIMFTFTTSSPF